MSGHVGKAWQFTEAAWSDGFGRCVRVTRLRFAQGNMEKALGVTAWSGVDQKVTETVFVIFSACGAGDRQRQIHFVDSSLPLNGKVARSAG